VARFLTARGSLVTRPSALLEAGPFERDGLVISFWELETISSAAAEPRQAGAALASIHQHLGTYPSDRLPEWGGFEEARLVLDHARRSPLLDRAELLRLERGFERAEAIVLSARARSASFQAVHGDAHIGNVLSTARGAVWTDWEDAFVGPIEFDLACLRSKLLLFGEDRDAIEAMTAAYAGPWDPELTSELGLVRNVQVIAWLVVFAERQPELAPRMRARLGFLPG
ncbi:MAG: aminoglycoside phosphotransferase family protein, partial [Labilithrix sp.]|nr:aminoglycoside phosphotransferase family protein [Labilithrix sp.]